MSERRPPEPKVIVADPGVSAGISPAKSEKHSKKSKRVAEARVVDDEPRAMGLKNNIYDFPTDQAFMKHKIKRVEESIFSKKKDWINSNTQNWVKNTPFIYEYHKDADQALHTVRPNQTFVSVKRAQPKLPAIKDLVTPFLTEAIDE